MISRNTSLEIGITSADFRYNDLAIKKDKESQPFIMGTLLVYDEEIVINLASDFVDTAKVVQLAIEGDEAIGKYISSVSESEVILVGLSICSDKPLPLLTSKPIQPNTHILTNLKNTYKIRFQDSDDFAPGEVFDRLLYSIFTTIYLYKLY